MTYKSFFKIAFVNLLVFIFLLFITKPAFGAVKIYPHTDSVPGPVYQYGEKATTCHDHLKWCYNSDPWQTSDVYDTEPDGVKTFRRSGAAFYTSNVTVLCDLFGTCCNCKDFGPPPGHDWKALHDGTKNHPTDNSNWAQQSIVIPADITKITRVKWYEGVGTGQTAALYSQWDGSGASFRVGSPFTTTSGEVNPTDWFVTPGTTYYVRVHNPSGNLSLPLSSPCGPLGGVPPNCRWYIDWGGVPTLEENDPSKPHSTNDVYPSGRAYAGYFDGVSLNYGAAHFLEIAGGEKADIARMAVWAELPPPTITVSSCPDPGSTATVGWNPVTGATHYNLRIDNLSNPWLPPCTNPGDFCIDNYTSTSYSFASIPTNSYEWWVHSCNADGCSGATFGGFTCVHNCNTTPSCGACSAPPNTCSTNNGTQSCTYTEPTPCSPAPFTQSCTQNTCSGGYTCDTSSSPYACLVTLSASCLVSPTTAIVGETVGWFGGRTGGTGTYSYSWSGTDGLSGSTQNVTRSYATAGTKTATFTVSSGSQTVSVACSNSLTVYPLLDGSCSGSPNPAATGTTVTWTAFPSGGTGSYSYSWSGDVTGTANPVSTSYSSAGTKTAIVTITSGAQTLSTSCSINVSSGISGTLYVDSSRTCVSGPVYTLGATIDLSGPVSGSTITNGSGYYSFGGLPSGTYDVKLTSFDTSNYEIIAACPTTKSVFLGSPPTLNFHIAPKMPVIGELKVGNYDAINPPTFVGTPETSGLLFSQGGSNWRNSLKINLNATAYGVGNSIKSYIVAFYNQSIGVQGNLSGIKSALNSNSNNGFALLYENGTYYVWISGSWSPIPSSPGYKDVGTSYRVYIPSSLPANSWIVSLYKPFGGKQMYTAAYIEDTFGQFVFQGEKTTTFWP